MPQEDRIKNYTDFKNFKFRILVATDLVGRGIDIERVNIVINYDMPADDDSYLHRVVFLIAGGKSWTFRHQRT